MLSDLEINRHIRRPDLVVHLRVDAATAAERRRRRSGRAELYDDGDFQARLVEAYARMPERFPEDDIVQLDGARPAEHIAAEIWGHVEALRAAGAPV